MRACRYTLPPSQTKAPNELFKLRSIDINATINCYEVSLALDVSELNC